eukprot:scaffold90990_cov17-Prasinocladus_malaysianus.AAC.2
MEGHGFDARKTLECLMRNDCNYISATYFLLAEEKAESERNRTPSRGAETAAGTSTNTNTIAPHEGGRPSTAPSQPKPVVGNWDGRDDSAIAMHHRQQLQQQQQYQAALAMA